MKLLKLVVLVLFTMAFLLPAAFNSNRVQSQTGATEAPTGFDNQTNNFVTQATFTADLAVFEERDDISKGLGPVYNAQSCAECHQNPVTGAISQITAFGRMVLPGASWRVTLTEPPPVGDSGAGAGAPQVRRL